MKNTINFGANWLIYNDKIMKHLQDIISESIFDVEDNMRKVDDVALKQAFLDWWDVTGPMKRYATIKIEDERISLPTDPVYVYKGTGLLPKFIKFDKVRRFDITDNQRFFDKCKSQFPKTTRYLSFEGIDVHDLEIEALDVDFRKRVKSIKNVTITIPEQRPGLSGNNVFYINFNTSMRNIKGLKIRSQGKNIIVNSHDGELGNFTTNQIKYEVGSYKRKNGPFKDQYELNKFIMDILYKHLPLDHIDEHWEGVRRIVFKDRSGGLHNGVGLGFGNEGYLKSGDFMIERINGEWRPFQKMFRLK